MFLYSRYNALRKELCDAFISEFEVSPEKRPGSVGYQNSTNTESVIKKSTDITFSPDYLRHPSWGPLLQELMKVVDDNFVRYVSRYEEAFYNLDPLEISTLFNMQRYEPGEAFYKYHCEVGSAEYSNRVLVWMMYLNDMTEGGETEFYFQKEYEYPRAGKLMIWPAYWTHLHRGIPSLTQKKYILTGWFNFKKTNK